MPISQGNEQLNLGQIMGIKHATRRRAAAGLAALATLIMSSGIALMLSAAPASAAAGPNDPDYWETLAGEVCQKTDTGAESGGFTVPAAPEDAVWSKLILKKGSGNIGEENQVFNNPVPGQTYTWQGFNDAQDGGWSHYILCYVPEPEPEEVTPDVTWTEPDCDNENTATWQGQNTDHIGYAVTSGTPGPGASVEVTATADDGFVFPDDTTSKVFAHTFGAAETPCDVVAGPRVTPEVSFVDPTCDTDPAVVLPEQDEVEVPSRTAAGPVITTKDVNGVHYEVTGTLAPGGTVEVDASAIAPNELAEGAQTHWSHTFPELTGCTVVDPPVVDTPGSTEDTPTVVATPQVVHAGLAEVKPDLRGQQGLALLVAGMILMAVAGGVGLTGRRVEQS